MADTSEHHQDRVVSFFQASGIFSIQNPKFGPILFILSQIYILFGVFLQALNNAMVYQH